MASFSLAGIDPMDLLAWWGQHKDDLLQLETYREQWVAITDAADTDAGMKKRVEIALNTSKLLAKLSGNDRAQEVAETVADILDNDALLHVVTKLLAPLFKADPKSGDLKPLSVCDHLDSNSDERHKFSRAASLASDVIAALSAP